MGAGTQVFRPQGVDLEAHPKRVTQTTRKECYENPTFHSREFDPSRGLLLSQSPYKSLLFLSGGDFSIDAGGAQPFQQKSNPRALRYAKAGQITSVEAWLHVPPFVQVAQGQTG